MGNCYEGVARRTSRASSWLDFFLRPPPQARYSPWYLVTHGRGRLYNTLLWAFFGVFMEFSRSGHLNILSVITGPVYYAFPGDYKSYATV